MSEIADEIYNSGVQRGIERTKAELSCSWVKKGMSTENIAQLLNVDVTLVQKWIAEASLVPVG